MELREGTPQEAGMLPERIDRVRDLAAGWVKEGYTSALRVLVARRGRVVLDEAFGRLRPEVDSPSLELDSLFPMASITKVLTATTAMMLVEDGLLGLNRPVIDYLPNFVGEGKDEVLVHHLLTHTSGMVDLDLIVDAMKRAAEGEELPPCPPNQHPAIHEWICWGLEGPLSRKAGEVMAYSTAGYLILSEIVRRVSGRSIEDLARERIFGPLGMTDSYLSLPESLRERVVRRPSNAPMAQPSPAWQGIETREFEETPWPDRGLYSTARDVAVLGQAFLNGGTYGDTRLLSPPTVAEMTRNQIPGLEFVLGDRSGEASMGYGWFLEGPAKWRPFGSLQSRGALNHLGLGGAALWVDPTYEIVGVYLEPLLRASPDFEPFWNFDLFQNAVTSAVDD